MSTRGQKCINCLCIGIHSLLVNPSVIADEFNCLLQQGSEQFPSLLENTNGRNLYIFPSAIWMWIVPMATGKYRRTQSIHISIDNVDVNSSNRLWKIPMNLICLYFHRRCAQFMPDCACIAFYLPCKYLNWKLSTQLNNNSDKINISWYKI